MHVKDNEIRNANYYKKKNPDISVLHVYSQTLVTGGTTQQNIKPWKADFWEIAPHLPYLLHPAPLHRPKTATCHPTHPCQSIAHHRPATCHPTLHCKSAYQNWTRSPTFQHLITTLHHPEIQQCPKQLPRKPLGSIHSRRS